VIVLFHVLVFVFTAVHRLQAAADTARTDLRVIQAQLHRWAYPNPLRAGDYVSRHHHSDRSRQLRASTLRASTVQASAAPYYAVSGGGR